MASELIRQAMSELGRRTSARKASAARANGKLGGRPKSSRSKRNPTARIKRSPSPGRKVVELTLEKDEYSQE